METVKAAEHLFAVPIEFFNISEIFSELIMPPKRPAIMLKSKHKTSGSKKLEKPMKDEFDKFVIKYEKEIEESEKKFA